MSIILGVFEEGLVYAIMALGVYITYLWTEHFRLAEP